MKKFIPVLALLALPACFGVSDSSVASARASVDPVMNQQLEATLAGARAGRSVPIEYNSTAATASQIHANYMVENNTISIIIDGKDSDDATDGIQAWDIGDTLAKDLGLGWDDIIQMVGAGDVTADAMLTEWLANGSPAGSFGESAGALDAALDVDDYTIFGIAKAGSGADTKWAFIVVDPTAN